MGGWRCPVSGMQGEPLDTFKGSFEGVATSSSEEQTQMVSTSVAASTSLLSGLGDLVGWPWQFTQARLSTLGQPPRSHFIVCFGPHISWVLPTVLPLAESDHDPPT